MQLDLKEGRGDGPCVGAPTALGVAGSEPFAVDAVRLCLLVSWLVLPALEFGQHWL